MERLSMKSSLETLFEDEHLIVLNKPAHLLVIEDRYDKDLPNVKAILQKKYGEIYPVHRIDKTTTGAICFAKTSDSHKELSLLFLSQSIQKKYQAILNGNLFQPEGLIDTGIAESRSKKGTYVVERSGKKSQTKYALLENFKAYAHVEFELITGRTHQIRVHAKHLGHPIVGDQKYNPSPEFLISQIKRKRFNMKKNTVERSFVNRPLLHAHSLQFKHPFTGVETNIQAVLPKDMRAVLNQLRKWNAL